MIGVGAKDCAETTARQEADHAENRIKYRRLWRLWYRGAIRADQAFENF